MFYPIPVLFITLVTIILCSNGYHFQLHKILSPSFFIAPPHPFHSNYPGAMSLNQWGSKTTLFLSDSINPEAKTREKMTEVEGGGESEEESKGIDPFANETPEEKYKREKLAEIAERKAAEVFVVRDTGKYECQSCGYIYNTAVGMPKKGVPPGTPWDSIEKFRCPQCGASKKYFVAETEEISGFKENLKYGLGGNSLTAGQKSNLIFGGLFIGFLIFMSGYLLE